MSQPKKRIVNIVDDAGIMNIGIWHPAISSAGFFKKSGISTQLLFPEGPSPKTDLPVDLVALKSTSLSYLHELIGQGKLNSEEDIIVTHGCWRYCTRWGNELSKKGFDWIYTPHGMLDSWALKQKAVRKALYFYFLEKPMALRAKGIRAVSQNEADRLTRLFPSSEISAVPNGVESGECIFHSNADTVKYLFLGRIHKKKGIAEVIKGWQMSMLNNDEKFQLMIAGPDDGELTNIQPIFSRSSNIQYIGPVYGENKKMVFQSAQFFILPSFSEGFPATVLEAMSYGLICLISEGCNIPEAFYQNIAFEVVPTPENIAAALNHTLKISKEQMQDIAQKAQLFVAENYSVRRISECLLQTYIGQYDLATI